MSAADAMVVNLALTLLGAPDQLAAIRRERLPDDLRLLLRIVAADTDAIATATRLTGASEATVREAASLFVQQVLLDSDGDSYRVLGVNPDAADLRIREHHRLLLRWLHPDRNRDGWESIHVYRVNGAWQDLRRPEQRRQFDRKRKEHGDAGMSASGLRAASMLPVDDETDLRRVVVSARVRRHLPAVALGGTAILASFMLIALYTLRPPSASPPPAGALSDDTTSAELALPTVASTGTDATEPMPVLQPESRTDRPAPQQETAFGNGADAGSPRQTDLSPGSEQPGAAPAPIAAPATSMQAAGSSFASRPIGTLPLVVVAEPPAPSVSNVDTAVSLVAPVLTVPVPEAGLKIAPVSTAMIDEARANLLVDRFAEAYEAGDLQRLSALLTREAGDGGYGREAILREYRQLFRNTDQRRMRIAAINWIEDAEVAFIIASFDASVVERRRSRAREVKGDIRFDLRVEDGDLRIHRLRHYSHGS